MKFSEILTQATALLQHRGRLSYRTLRLEFALDEEQLDVLKEQLIDIEALAVDHDGKIRMDCSSPYAMARLVGLKDQYQVAFANDPDSDRHGIVTPSAGLMNPNHYLAVSGGLFAQSPSRVAGSRCCGQDAR